MDFYHCQVISFVSRCPHNLSKIDRIEGFVPTSDTDRSQQVHTDRQTDRRDICMQSALSLLATDRNKPAISDAYSLGRRHTATDDDRDEAVKCNIYIFATQLRRI